MTFTQDYLYGLLPAIYRIRDAENGGVLYGLMGVLAAQAQAVEADIGQLYNNWFIETCEEWVVPYIGDLLGVRGLHDVSGAGFSQRARVANTLLYRQGKGTARVLRQIAGDSTGWPAMAVEYFNLLATTQHMSHVRADRGQTVDVRDANRLEKLNTPLDSIAHNGEVRHIDTAAGKYNIPDIGLFLWRLQPYTVTRTHAWAVAANDGRYRFDPTGLDIPLFNPSSVPAPVSRRALYADLEALRQSLVDGTEYTSLYFGGTPLVEIWLNGKKVDPSQITACNLADPAKAIPLGWQRPPASKTYKITGSGSPVVRNILVGVDPVLGRIALPQGVAPVEVWASYSYGFPGDVGAGPYDRREPLAAWINPAARRVDFQIGVTKNPDLLAGNPPNLVGSLSEALLAWNTYTAKNPAAMGIVAILDCQTYAENLTGSQKIEVTPGSTLAIIGAGWPIIGDPAQGEIRATGEFTPSAVRPHIRGDIEIHATAGTSAAGVILDGILLEGKVTVLPGELAQLQIGHCTLVPSKGGLIVAAGNAAGQLNESLNIALLRCICGPVTLPDSTPTLAIQDCIAGAVTAKGAEMNADSVTFYGAVTSRVLNASNAIFTQPVTAVRRQTGCVRYSYVPAGSATPRRYWCMPDVELRNVTNPATIAATQLRVTPTFSSVVFGDPAYAQLSRSCAAEISTGASDGSEMGAFHYLMQPQRRINLQSSLGEYLRFGLEAGLFFVS